MHPQRFVRELGPEKVEELFEVYRHTHDARLRSRCQMILLSSQGRPVSEIARVTMFSEDAVLFWLERYDNEGLEGLKDRPRSGRPSKSHARG